MSDFVRYTSEQFFEWGALRWYFEPGDMDTDRLSVGIATYTPAGVQEMHPHFREEQVLYVISGSGLHSINGQTELLTPGSIVHLPSYSVHGLTNNSGSEELKVLLVYSPSRFQPLMAQERADGEAFALVAASLEQPDEQYDGQSGMFGPAGNAQTLEAEPEEGADGILGLFDAEAIGSIRASMERLSQALGLSLALLDTAGKCLFKTANHPELCSTLAELGNGAYCLEQMRPMLASFSSMPEEQLRKPHFITCCNKIASTVIPIFYNGQIQAYMKCGEVFLGQADRDFLLANLPETAERYGASAAKLSDLACGIPILPKSRLYTAAEATFAIANTISGMAAQALRQRELNESKLSLARQQLATASLEKALQQADLKLLQSQITPHFLFNTLNTIAQMAYVEDATRAAELTWSLSELLRVTLRKTEELIPLHEEFSLLKSYIHIQQERFGERIAFSTHMDELAREVPVPCMLFQPLVENSIIHGLEPAVGKGRIDVSITLEAGRVRAVIEDDGVGFDVESMHSRGNKIGLRSIQNRLEHYFGTGQGMSIRSKPGKGTRIELHFPAGSIAARSEPQNGRGGA